MRPFGRCSSCESHAPRNDEHCREGDIDADIKRTRDVVVERRTICSRNEASPARAPRMPGTIPTACGMRKIARPGRRKDTYDKRAIEASDVMAG